MAKITYEDFQKVEICAGKILSAEKIPDTDKLLKLMVDFGEVTPASLSTPTDSVTPGPATLVPPGTPAPRQIVSGIATYFPDPSVLVGKTCMFVTNLEPRTIKGYESNGMLFAVSTSTGVFSLLEPKEGIPPGTRAK